MNINQSAALSLFSSISGATFNSNWTPQGMLADLGSPVEYEVTVGTTPQSVGSSLHQWVRIKNPVTAKIGQMFCVRVNGVIPSAKRGQAFTSSAPSITGGVESEEYYSSSGGLGLAIDSAALVGGTPYKVGTNLNMIHIIFTMVILCTLYSLP